MKLLGTQKINEEGILTIGDVDVLSLRKMYGTPLYVMDQALIEQNINDFKKYFKSKDLNTEIIYASKAFLNVAMIQLIKRHGLSLDVVSGGELYTAVAASFPMEKIYFHGNNKSKSELEFAMNQSVGTIIIDNLNEYQMILDLLGDKKINLMVRLNPSVDADTHEYIKTTKDDSKFGLSIYSQETLYLIREINNHPLLTFKGLHVHIGSQLMDLKPYFNTIKTMIEYMSNLQKNDQIFTDYINIGGGFGVSYLENDESLNPSKLKEIIDYIYDLSIKYKVKLPTLMIEPGRSIVGQSGTTLYTVGTTKKTNSKKSYVFVDGSMADHIRTALYQAKYRAYLANRMNDQIEEIYTVAGKACESGDIIIKDIGLPTPNPNDLLAVFVTGAYHYSMASNYNRLTKPAVIFVKDGKSVIAVKRETYQDLLSHDIQDGGII